MSHKEKYSTEQMEQHLKDMQDLNEAASALFRIPVFFSHQNLFTLSPTRQRFIVRMFNEIKRVLLFPRTLPNTEEYPDTTLENIRTMVNSSYGLAAALLVPTGPTAQHETYSPFLQIEPAMAYQYGLPLLLVIENAMQGQAGGVWNGLAPFTPIVWFSNTQTVEQFLIAFHGRKLYRTGQDKYEAVILHKQDPNFNINLTIIYKKIFMIISNPF